MADSYDVDVVACLRRLVRALDPRQQCGAILVTKLVEKLDPLQSCSDVEHRLNLSPADDAGRERQQPYVAPRITETTRTLLLGTLPVRRYRPLPGNLHVVRPVPHPWPIGCTVATEPDCVLHVFLTESESCDLRRHRRVYDTNRPAASVGSPRSEDKSDSSRLI